LQFFKSVLTMAPNEQEQEFALELVRHRRQHRHQPPPITPGQGLLQLHLSPADRAVLVNRLSASEMLRNESTIRLLRARARALDTDQRAQRLRFCTIL